MDKTQQEIYSDILTLLVDISASQKATIDVISNEMFKEDENRINRMKREINRLTPEYRLEILSQLNKP